MLEHKFLKKIILNKGNFRELFHLLFVNKKLSSEYIKILNVSCVSLIHKEKQYSHEKKRITLSFNKKTKIGLCEQQHILPNYEDQWQNTYGYRPIEMRHLEIHGLSIEHMKSRYKKEYDGIYMIRSILDKNMEKDEPMLNQFSVSLPSSDDSEDKNSDDDNINLPHRQCLLNPEEDDIWDGIPENYLYTYYHGLFSDNEDTFQKNLEEVLGMGNLGIAQCNQHLDRLLDNLLHMPKDFFNFELDSFLTVKVSNEYAIPLILLIENTRKEFNRDCLFQYYMAQIYWKWLDNFCYISFPMNPEIEIAGFYDKNKKNLDIFELDHEKIPYPIKLLLLFHNETFILNHVMLVCDIQEL